MVGEPWDSIDKWHDITPNSYFWKQIIFHESKWIALSVFWISRPQLQIFFFVWEKWWSLLSSCTKSGTNNARIEYKYPAILYSYLESWLFSTVKKPVWQVGYTCLYNCSIVVSSHPSAPQVPATIDAKRRRFVIESDDENEL